MKRIYLSVPTDKAHHGKCGFRHGGRHICIVPIGEVTYDKHRYEQSKREREMRKNQKVITIKEVQLSCRIEQHDFDTKVKRAIEFLSKGNKVRVALRFKGREMAHQDRGHEVIERFIEACSEYGTVDKKPVLEGRQITLNIAPIKK